MMWLAITLGSIAALFLAGLIAVHLIDNHNGDEWDDDK